MLSLHYNGSSILFVKSKEIYQFKENDSDMKKYLLCLGNISKDFTSINMKKTGLDRYVSEFSIDCNIIDINNIIDFHKYLMKNMI